MLWIKYSSCLHWIVLICYKLSEGFCFDNLYSILMYRDKGREFLRKFMEFLLFNIHLLREIYCLFKLKRLLELIINQSWHQWISGNINWLITWDFNYCVPVLFRVSRRAKRQNILLDVVQRVVQHNSYKHDIRNSKRSFT